MLWIKGRKLVDLLLRNSAHSLVGGEKVQMGFLESSVALHSLILSFDNFQILI